MKKIIVLTAILSTTIAMATPAYKMNQAYMMGVQKATQVINSGAFNNHLASAYNKGVMNVMMKERALAYKDGYMSKMRELHAK